MVELPPTERTLTAPASSDEGDLDLHVFWRAARIRQILPEIDRRWSIRQFSQLVIRDGIAHRALLMLPSSDGSSTLMSFRIEMPPGSHDELITWVGLADGAARHSDGVDYGVAIGDGDVDPSTLHLQFHRLTRELGSTGWQEVRLDLSSYAGRTVWLVLASRDSKNRAGDWLLWADPQIRASDGDRGFRVDLAHATASGGRPVRTPWSELNVFKAYSRFNDEEILRSKPELLSRSFPWLRSIRLFSSLGGNWGPTMETDYDGQMGHNPSSDSRWEARWARKYEFFRDGGSPDAPPIDDRFDWVNFDALLDAAAESGLALHLNLAGAPELFTGGKGYYRTYHYNEMPVVDGPGWKHYVAAVWAHLSTRPWFGTSHYSFFSEPNSRWVDDRLNVTQFGYQGNPEEYARQYLWTWQAMKSFLHSGQLHFGPWVVEPDPGDPVNDNLSEHLAAVERSFRNAGAELPDWSAFAFNLYETPQLPIDGFIKYKIDAIRGLLTEQLPGRDLPIRLDEFGIHPLVYQAFDQVPDHQIENSRWATTWHAEMLALLIDQDLQQGGPWLPVLLQRTALAYLFLSEVEGAIELDLSSGEEIRVRSASDQDGRADWTTGASLASNHAARIGSLWSAAPGGEHRRIAIWNHPRFPTTDERLAREHEVEHVDLLLSGDSGRRWKLTLIGSADQSFPALEDEQEREVGVAGFPAVGRLRRETAIVREHFELDVRAGDLFLIEADQIR